MTKIDNNTLFFGNFVDADLKLADLNDYLNDVSKFIDRKKKHKEKTYKENILKDIAIKMFSESFTSILFESALISAWVFMEEEFKGYCNAMQKAMAIDLSYSDLKGSAIERFRVYTSKVLNLNFKFKDENWEDLKAITEIRNSIIHTEGSVGNKKLVSSFLKRNKLPMLLSDDKIAIDKDSLSIIITLCRLFVERIYTVALCKFPGQYGSKKGSN
jgi:hypothetical protein